MNMKKLWVLTALREHEEYPSSVEVIGLYNSKESAKEAMEESTYKEIKIFSNEHDDIEMEFGDEMCYVSDMEDGFERSEFAISVREIKD